MLFVAAAVLAGALPDPVTALPSKLSSSGKLDFTYASAVRSAGGAGTTYKPESKLFYTGDGVAEPIRWWSVLGSPASSPAAGVWLWELDDHVWEPEVLLPGADAWAKADTLYEGGTLYVSLRDNKSSATGNPRASTLYSTVYLGGGNWGPVSGPTTITTSSPETLTIARDSSGRLWTTYESGNKIVVGSTAPSGTSFTFRTISKSNVKGDDISAVTAFGGDRIGVFWSDQNARRNVFAWRSDSDAVMADWHYETAYGGGVGRCPTRASAQCADDHINIKVHGDEVFVAIKSSLNDGSSPAASDPLISLLHRDDDGDWAASTVSTVAQNATRPIVVLSPSQAKVWVWATRGNEVVVWESSLNTLSFNPSASTAWVKGVSANDATSTKQTTTARTGVVVEVSAAGKNQFWHNEFLPS
jgi:hypothetical protein